MPVQASAVAMQLDYVRNQIGKVPILKKYAVLLEEKTKVNYEYFATGIMGVLLFMLFTGYGDEIVVHLFAFVYPFIATIKCIEKTGGEPDELTEWLMYWVVYGFLGVFDSFGDIILYWIPFFSPLKLAFLVWCWAPQTKGSTVIYKNVVRPLFNMHGNEIDAALNSIDPKIVGKEGHKE
mmetsp:Transcript_25165/g.24101  ORF Transcript_25165/g.24101 Transcript_25165/m.24101 type:complete len:179 (-) Transcript_25165:326-862(-)